MTKDQFKMGESPTVSVHSCGDLTVRGWAEASVQIKGDYRIKETDKGIRLDSQGSLYLYLPREAMLTLGRVDGDLRIKQFTGTVAGEYVHGDAVFAQANDVALGIVHGDVAARNMIGLLSIDEVNGDVAARVIGEARLGAVHGDFSARIINGDVTIDSIHGDADLRTVNGSVTVSQGFRDVNLYNVGGLVSVAGVTGDIRLRGGLSDGEHSLEARGDVVVRWPANVALNLAVTAPRIDNRLPMDEVTDKPGSLAGRIGNGQTSLTILAGGRVILREEDLTKEKWSDNGGDMEFDIGINMDDIASRIEGEVQGHLSRVTREIESKFGPDFSQRINEKIARKVEKAGARRRTEPNSRFVGAAFATTGAETPKKSVTTEEQLKILKMVETGKISPEEAGMLLEALES
ncbi:MAG: hypothetical protein H6663_05510 [Candidatus Promineofilum sp.]|uniref:SHOCT-like domain-containing protein n=1 Tax=Promineifilum sp. TaxID=2664178 RepID=UPI0024119CFA|nr:hypothetical protein [Promineifilum sp.]MCO5178491.1 hypothetical protein [Promineifilum sp.]